MSAKARHEICHVFCGHKQVFYPEITAQLLKLFTVCLPVPQFFVFFRTAAPLSTHPSHFKRHEPWSAGELNAPGVFWGRVLISEQLMHKLVLLLLKHTADIFCCRCCCFSENQPSLFSALSLTFPCPPAPASQSSGEASDPEGH